MIEDADVDLLHIVPCPEADRALRVPHEGDVVVVEDQDLAPDQNKVIIVSHKLNGPQPRFLMERKLYLKNIFQMLPYSRLTNMKGKKLYLFI